MKHSFISHGSWQIKRLNCNIILIRSKDNWNKEAAQEFATEFKAIAAAISGSPWAVIGSTIESEIMTPDAVPIIQDLNDWAIDNHCICEATIVKYQLQSMNVAESRSAIGSRQYEHQSFNDIPAAIGFIESHGFDLGSELQEATDWLAE